jgi:hypothetical protein
VLVVVVLLLAAACSGGDAGSADRGTTTSGAPASNAPAKSARTTTTTEAPPPLASAARSDACPGFVGATTSLASTGATGPAVLVAATAGAQGCLDVVTLTFQSRGDGTPPGYVVQYHDQVKEPFMDGDPPRAIGVEGAATLLVTVSPAGSTDVALPGNPPTYTGNLLLRYGSHHHLQVVRKLPDGLDAKGQGTVNWVIGLDSVRPFRVDRAALPARVTIFIG